MPRDGPDGQRGERSAACAGCSVVLASQAFWVTVALLLICAVMTVLQPAAFASAENFYNITRNFAFIGIMALGMTAVIITGGIDLSVGSIMGAGGDRCRAAAAGWPARGLSRWGQDLRRASSPAR